MCMLAGLIQCRQCRRINAATWTCQFLACTCCRGDAAQLDDDLALTISACGSPALRGQTACCRANRC